MKPKRQHHAEKHIIDKRVKILRKRSSGRAEYFFFIKAPFWIYKCSASNTSFTISNDICPGALACPGLAKVMAEPRASPARRLTEPRAPMLMVMMGVSGCRSAISAVAARSSSTSARLWGITASLGRSAPACCMATMRLTSSARGGVLWKSWLEHTTAAPAVRASSISAGSSAPAVKNSMSIRSAQSVARTTRINEDTLRETERLCRPRPLCGR